MNKNLRFGTVLLAVLIISLLLVTGCRSGGEKAANKETATELTQDIEKAHQDIEQAGKIFSKKEILSLPR